ncbi:hypothetical protein [Asanoa ishikariensis]|uniref:hypothetical protein n=1 Tax=Asanoa ishikariensis TaxID=137265 RepID=UPI0015A0B1F9
MTVEVLVLLCERDQDVGAANHRRRDGRRLVGGECLPQRWIGSQVGCPDGAH